jgi:hypothetical protein
MVSARAANDQILARKGVKLSEAGVSELTKLKNM